MASFVALSLTFHLFPLSFTSSPTVTMKMPINPHESPRSQLPILSPSQCGAPAFRRSCREKGKKQKSAKSQIIEQKKARRQKRASATLLQNVNAFKASQRRPEKRRAALFLNMIKIHISLSLAAHYLAIAWRWQAWWVGRWRIISSAVGGWYRPHMVSLILKCLIFGNPQYGSTKILKKPCNSTCN